MLKNTFSYVFSTALVFTDFLAILVAFTVAYLVRVDIDTRPVVAEIPAREFVLAFTVLVPIWLVIFASIGLYKQETYTKPLRQFYKVMYGTALGMLVILAYDWGTDDEVFPARLVPIYAYFMAAALLLVGRWFMDYGRRLLFRKGVGVKNVLLIGNSPMTTELIGLFANTKATGYKVVAAAAKDNFVFRKVKRLKGVDSALKFMNEQDVHVVIQTERYQKPETNQQPRVRR